LRGCMDGSVVDGMLVGQVGIAKNISVGVERRWATSIPI